MGGRPLNVLPHTSLSNDDILQSLSNFSNSLGILASIIQKLHHAAGAFLLFCYRGGGEDRLQQTMVRRSSIRMTLPLHLCAKVCEDMIGTAVGITCGRIQERLRNPANGGGAAATIEVSCQDNLIGCLLMSVDAIDVQVAKACR